MREKTRERNSSTFAPISSYTRNPSPKNMNKFPISSSFIQIVVIVVTIWLLMISIIPWLSTKVDNSSSLVCKKFYRSAIINRVVNIKTTQCQGYDPRRRVIEPIFIISLANLSFIWIRWLQFMSFMCKNRKRARVLLFIDGSVHLFVSVWLQVSSIFLVLRSSFL